jgi:hypothetical protein
MTGTLSRIPRGRNVVASHLESLGIAADVPGSDTTTATRNVQRHPTPLPGTELSPAARRFSPDLVQALRETLRRGDLTLTELRSALMSARLGNEEDIHRVLEHTIRLKRTIIALGANALLLMKHVHSDAVLALLRGWVTPAEQGAPAAPVPRVA